MKGRMKSLHTVLSALNRLNDRLFTHKLPWGFTTALLISCAMFVCNISWGPLANLNDIGNWANRLQFLLLSAACETLVLTAAVMGEERSFAFLLLRQGMLAAFFIISFLAINQKTYYYSVQLQPIIRAMDSSGLRAASNSGFSAPMAALLYIITRGPVYDMYMVKLFCTVCFALCALLLANMAEPGLRGDGMLLLCLLLPQAFLSAACAGQTEIVAVLLFLASAQCLKCKKMALAAVFAGMGCALSGLVILAVPFLLRKEKELSACWRFAVCLVGTAWICVLPALVSGWTLWEVLKGFLCSIVGVPAYASGSPGLFGFFPRAAVEEMPEFFLLRMLPELDLRTNATSFYTQAHFDMLMRGLSITGLATYIGVASWTMRHERLSTLHKALLLCTLALFVMPGAGMGSWLLVDLLCIAAICLEPSLRIPACLLLFTTAAGCCYPVTEEILLRPAYSSGLTVIAIIMLAGFIPGHPLRVTSHP